MNGEVKREAPKPPRHTLKEVLVSIGRLFYHNLGWKIMALLLAITLWAGLITQDSSLTRPKTFTDVTVNVVGAETLQSSGYIVTTDLTSTPITVRLRVDVPQMQFSEVTASTYNARLDLSRIREEGDQTLKVTATSSSTYGAVMEISPDTVDVTVERYVTRYRIPVSVVQTGEAPEGYYASTPVLDPPLVAVSGPRSLVEQVSRALVTVDNSTLPQQTGIVRTNLPMQLVDGENNPIVSDLLRITSESVRVTGVVVERTMYHMQRMTLSDFALTTGTPADGYEIKSVTVTPEVVSAAGSPEVLETLTELYLDQAADVSGADESFTQTIKIRKPSELVYLSQDTATVAVEIGPVIQSRTFDNVKLNVVNLGDGLSAALSESRLSVTVTGPVNFLDSLKASSLTLSVDAEGLRAGTAELTPDCAISGNAEERYTYVTNPETVTLSITEK